MPLTRLTYAFCRHLPEIEQRGVALQTSYGEFCIPAGMHADLIAGVFKDYLESELRKLRDAAPSEERGCQ